VIGGYSDVQREMNIAVQQTICRGRGILCRTHQWPHNLYIVVPLFFVINFTDDVCNDII